MGDSFYRSKDPTNSIKVLKEKLQGLKSFLFSRAHNWYTLPTTSTYEVTT